MKPSLLPVLLLYGLITGCLSSRIDLPPEQEFIEFSTLSLTPSYEMFNLRLDLIRQSDESGDSVVTTDLRAYHPIGFELGDGLFFDLNSNLSLRLDQMPEIDDQQRFKIKKVQNLYNERGTIYTFQGDELCTLKEKQFGLGKENCYQIRREGAVLSLWKKKRYFMEIAFEQGTMSYKRSQLRTKPNDSIIPAEGGSYYVNKDRKRNRYILDDGTVSLGNLYLIRRTDEGKKLEIYRTRTLNRHKLLYSIRKTEDTLFIYNQYGKGKIIRHSDRQIEVIRKGKVQQRLFILEE